MSTTALTLGIDLGGTKIDIGVVDPFGKIVARELINTSKESPQMVVKDIFHAVKKLKQTHERFLAAGVGMAGQIDRESGLVHFAPNLGWVDFPLKEALEKVLRVPVRVTNDVRAAAWGEWLYGAGQDCNDLICLFVGTGIGAGIVSGGKMLTGCCNTAGEVGHMTLDLNGPPCSCGNHGCFEALAGGWAIARRAKDLLANDPMNSKKLLDLIGGTFDEINAKKMIEASRLKVPVAVKVMNEVKEALIAGVASLVNGFNPKKVILGGGIITGAPDLIDAIKEGVPTRALKASAEFLEVVQAQLKGDAGVVGAAAQAVGLKSCLNT